MKSLTIMDPVTRIEGHMKVELEIEHNEIIDARCAGTLFRGFETILEDRDPWDAPVITQRICGVCPISHAQASVLALDDAAKRTPTANGRILRNLTLGANYIQSHILHFYLLALLDYAPGPPISPWTPAWDIDMRGGLDKTVGNLVDKALAARRKAHEMGAVFGGKMPASHAIIPGGFTAKPTSGNIKKFRRHLDWLTGFIQNTYIPDVQAVADIYSDYFKVGVGHKNLLAYGVFELNDQGTKKLFRPGYAINAGKLRPLDLSGKDITESVTHSWYDDGDNNLTPIKGATTPAYPKAEEAYSWLKAPRLKGKPFEVGPLARMWINGNYRRGISVMDRYLARAKEALKIAKAMKRWLSELAPGGKVYNGYPRLRSGLGIGMTEAPRGALGHWVRIARGRIAHYQVVTPTCWNASPMDDKHVHGPMEAALIGTPIEDPEKPIEALRVIHSFDPCLSCAVHIMQPNREPVVLRAGLAPL